MVKRCDWVTEETLYIDYHDKEWGRPLYDRRRLFEMLCLEGAQAGLSWWTILKRREAYREAFDYFDPSIVAQYDEKKIEERLQNKDIIRNRLKINSVVKNAKALLAIEEKGITFTDYIWQFVDGKALTNQWNTHEEVPAMTDISQRMSKQLKADGFTFVGPTICYAYMQAVGMVNDHLTDCFCYEEIEKSKGMD